MKNMWERLRKMFTKKPNHQASAPYFDYTENIAYFYAINQALIVDLKTSCNITVIFAGDSKEGYITHKAVIAVKPNVICIRLRYGIAEKFSHNEEIVEDKEEILINITRL